MAKVPTYPHDCPICGYHWDSRFENPTQCANCKIILEIANEIAAKSIHSVQGMQKAVKQIVQEKGQTTLDKQIAKVDENLDDDNNPPLKPHSKKRQCPFCKKWIWTEYAQKHYSDSHEGAQI